jgi:uncharacterized protein YndB with AHSA1/START domain
MTKSRDRVEREIVIRAPVERVYAALTDPSLYPTWGPERVEGTLAPGERPIFDFGPGGGGKVAVYVVAVEPPRYFAYRWMQGETDPEVLLGDPLGRPNTLVEFHVEAFEDGTRVRVVESGVSSLPAVPGVDIDAGLDSMGKGWQLMLGGLARHFLPGSGSDDMIENEIVVRAPREQVFEALLHPERWWATKVEGRMAAGELPVLDFGQFGRVRIEVFEVDPPDHLVFRWVQGVDDPARRLEDPRENPSTTVEFRLDATPEGTRIRHRESGFGALSGEGIHVHFKRAQQAWGIILGLLEMHLARS